MPDFRSLFDDLSRIGATSRGGVDRQALTPEDGAARRWLLDTLGAAGMRTHVDEIGNVFGIYDWVPGAPVILTGSHLDSQPTGGRFDGAYGVLASVAAAGRLDAARRSGDLNPVFNLAVVDWTNEEGARFQPSVMGSSVYTGELSLETALRASDRDGTDVRSALHEIGAAGTGPLELRPAGYAEIHVEQGSHLEHAGIDIGLVTGNWAARKYDIRITGEQSHTGSTPMRQRKDAMYAAALVITGVREIATGAEVSMHSSVTQVHAYPDSPNVVTSSVTAHVELRAEHAASLDPAETAFHALLEAAAAQSGTEISVTRASRRGSERYWPEGIRIAGAAAKELGLSATELKTIAGHDSIQLNHIVPTIMLFVPSADGQAHNESEDTSTEDMLNGVQLLTGVLRRLVTDAAITEHAAANLDLSRG